MLGTVVAGPTAAIDADFEALAAGAAVLVVSSALVVWSGVVDRSSKA